MILNIHEALNLLNSCKDPNKNNDWIKHSICVGDTAAKIAKALNLDENYVKTLGYIHDIGKKFGINTISINGLNYGADYDCSSLMEAAKWIIREEEK